MGWQAPGPVIHRGAGRSIESSDHRTPGFAEHPEGFATDSYEVDEDQWSDGFVTVVGPDE
jgi:hypothetical protein